MIEQVETKDAKPAKPVTFRDRGYSRRTIKLGKDELRVEHGLVTVTEPKHVAALEKMHGLERVDV